MSTVKYGYLSKALRLATPYWRSEDWVRAWVLLVAVNLLNVGSVAVVIFLNFWRRDIFNALQHLDEREFFKQLLIFAIYAMALVSCLVYQVYLGQMLQIRWRRWLTRRYLSAWLAESIYYRLQIGGDGTDNPDQRIADDLDRFTRQTLALTVGNTGFIHAALTLIAFVAILWSLSGALTIRLGAIDSITIPGYMVWVGIIYAIGGTWLTFRIGRPLVGLNFRQQLYEADFRFSLVRLRENTECVAFYGGERREFGTFVDRFTHVVGNFWSIMKRVKLLGWYTQGYDQAAVIFPFLVAAPQYFSGQMELGGLMATAAAFFEMQVALSFIVKSYTEIAEWQSVVQRLSDFETRMKEIAASVKAPQQIVIEHEGEGLSISRLALDLPQGQPLLREVNLDAAPGEAVLIAGPAGTGKSTLLRAIAGIWPYGSGHIRVSEGRRLFLPQRPYIPLGSLRDALLYPHELDSIDDEHLIAALDEVGLSALGRQIDTVDSWAQRLSLGEQQRIAFARVLLTKPALVFLDEATSALDEPGEAMLYRLLREAPWHPTLVSVGHRSTLRPFHDRIVNLAPSREMAN
ncbi:MAG TPA: ABC transporter ATP-binding protein/permease, partial [Stellaceae bacterium]|nr:ABC transporter ATP-binding protein/permease [Stellaceae bacterium]